MRKAHIVNNVVVNVIEVDLANIPDWCVDWPDAGAEVDIGFTHSNGSFFPQPTPAPDFEAIRATMKLSFPQLLIGLVSEEWISEAEGDAWADGTLPAAVLAVIGTLPSEMQFAARTRAKRPSEVVRLDPLVQALGAIQGKTDAELDTFFETYSLV